MEAFCSSARRPRRLQSVAAVCGDRPSKPPRRRTPRTSLSRAATAALLICASTTCSTLSTLALAAPTEQDPATNSDEAGTGTAAWLTHFSTGDPDCWSKNGLLDWERYRRHFFDMMKDARSLESIPAYPQFEAFEKSWLHVLENFPVALRECPLGTIASSLLAAAWKQAKWKQASPLPEYWESTPLLDLLGRDVVETLRYANFRVLVSTEWPIWKILCHVDLSTQSHEVLGEWNQPQSCGELSVAGYPAPFILDTISSFTDYAENKGLQAAKFLKELDPMIYGLMKDPREFGTVFLSQCPSGALSISVVSCILALMASPVLFEKFERIVQMLFNMQQGVLIQPETGTWKVFCMMHALSTFRLRSFDLAFAFEELVLEREPLGGLVQELPEAVGAPTAAAGAGAFLQLHAPPENCTSSWRMQVGGAKVLDVPVLSSPGSFDSLRNAGQSSLREKTAAKLRSRALLAGRVRHDAVRDRMLPALVQNRELHEWLADHFFPTRVVDSEDHNNPHVYLSAVGGKMMQPYLAGFVRRFFLELRLSALIIACLDEDGLAACVAEKSKFSNSSSEDPYRTLLCLDSRQGHVIYNKHRWVPVLLSMHIDVLWLDFDIFLFKDPVAHINSLKTDWGKKGKLDFEVKKQKQLPLNFANVPAKSHHPDEPEGFDTDAVEDLEHAVEVRPRSPDLEKQYSRANVKKVYREIHSAPQFLPLRDPAVEGSSTATTAGAASSSTDTKTSSARSINHRALEYKRAVEEQDPEVLPDIYVTEHYDALCINSGVFFVRASSRTLNFFVEFLRWQNDHVFADNQNGFDSFFQHSCADSYVPHEVAKHVTYGLLDVERSYLCAEGWHGPSVEQAVLFHFWTSDFDHKNKRRDGSPIRMKKKHYFDLFYPPVGTSRNDQEITALLEDLRYPRFRILEKCAVMTTGINELIEAKAEASGQQLSPSSTGSLKPNHQEFEQRRRLAVEKMELQKHRKEKLEELRGVYGVDFGAMENLVNALTDKVEEQERKLLAQDEKIMILRDQVGVLIGEVGKLSGKK